MEQPSGLGILATLPPEVRLLVWEHFLPDGQDVDYSSKVQKTDLSILRANRQLYDEISTHLYPKLWIEFEIRLLSSAIRGLKRAGLNVTITPPDPSDPGQLACLWKKTSNLMKLLQGLRSPPRHVTICLLDTPDAAAWHWDENPNTSVSNSLCHSCVDYQTVVSPFSRLRSIDRFAICPDSDFDVLRKIIDEDDILALIELVEVCAQTRERKPADKVHVDPKDCCDKQDAHCHTLYENFFLDVMLNTLYGPTTRILHLQRFSSWSVDRVGGHLEYKSILSAISRFYHRLWCLDNNMAPAEF
ncbi:hypothetical protein VTN77DRAFT_1254 [Rasamsonia byssochlamydoides]|uniref:uncharacterized protein n=1 Tax=Rasamsonia byssochlamydoides TaxID=89139 RepID=UPI0037441487